MIVNRLFPPHRLRKSSAVVYRSLYLETESFVNPQVMKYTVVPYQEILPQSYSKEILFQKGHPAQLAKSAAAKDILEIEFIKSVLIGRNFVTVTKSGIHPWFTISPFVIRILMEKLNVGGPLVIDDPTVSDTTILDTDDEIVATIKDLMSSRVRPSVQEDGGDIFYEGFDPIKGIVKVRLAGACIGCPSSAVTLRNGVENLLKHYIPEVKGIEEVGQVGKDIKEGKFLSQSSD